MPGRTTVDGKEGEEAFGGGSPAASGLAEILETGEGEDTLATTFGDDAGQTGQRGHVGEFVQREQQSRALGVTIVGGVDQLFDETDHEGNRHRLVATGRHDVQLMGTSQKLIYVERRLASRRAGRLRAHSGEESRGGRPDTRAFALFGGHDTPQERDRGMQFAMMVAQFAQEIVARSLIDARGQLTERLASHRARVHHGSDQCARAFGPMVVTSISSTASRDVKKAPRSQNSAIPS